ncbi:hypothetical protein V8F33_004649 [Rhypophila sp. PSN 637]
MFGTIRYDRQSQHAEFINRTDSFLSNTGGERAACDKCRLAKLKCTGQRSGCDRCQARHTLCVYSASGVRGPWQKRQQVACSSSSAREIKRQRRRGRKQVVELPLATVSSRPPLPTATLGDLDQHDHQDGHPLQESPDEEEHSPTLFDFSLELDIPPWPYDSESMPPPDAEFDFTNTFADREAFDMTIIASPSDSITSTLLSFPLLPPSPGTQHTNTSYDISSPDTSTWYSSPEPLNVELHPEPYGYPQILTTALEGLPDDHLIPISSLGIPETDTTPSHQVSLSDALSLLESQVANLGKTVQQELHCNNDNGSKPKHQCANQIILLIRVCEMLVNLSNQICTLRSKSCHSC